MFQMGGLGPMIGQLGFFHKFAGKDWEDTRRIDSTMVGGSRTPPPQTAPVETR